MHRHKISCIERSLIWDSQSDLLYHNIVGSQYEPFVEYSGPQGRLYQKLDRNTGNTTLTFVVDEIVKFEWEYIVSASVIESTQDAEHMMAMILGHLFINS